MASPESRYAGIRSPGRTSPKRLTVTASRADARRFGRGRERRHVQGVVQDAGVDVVGPRGRGGAQGGVEVDEVELGGSDARASAPPRPGRPRTGRPARPGPAPGRGSGRGRRARSGRAACHDAARTCPRWAAAGSARGPGREPPRDPGHRMRWLGSPHAEQPRRPGPPRCRGRGAHDAARGSPRIQAELDLPAEFPAEVQAAAEAAAAQPRLPELDRTDLPFVTVDPPGARDLDQALHLERAAPTTGYVVHYAIADVAAFVTPATRSTSRRTGAARRSTAPTRRCRCTRRCSPRTPPRCCPTRCVRRCCGRSRLDATGEGTDVHVERALVRSTRAAHLRAGAAGDRRRLRRREPRCCCKEIGELRLGREAVRGGVSLPLPEQDIDLEGDRWTLEFRSSCRSSGGTPRSRCSPASARRR